MLLTTALIIFSPAALFRALRNQWYVIHILLSLAAAYWLEQHYAFIAFHKVTFIYAIIVHLGVINIVTCALYGWDKRAAQRGYWRVPERSFHAFALIGGTLGAMIGSKVFRHKTAKISFRSRFLLIVLIQISILIYLAYALL